MRYRPFAQTGIAVSALSLALDGEKDTRRPGQWRDLLHAAFEAGINTFDLIQPSPALLTGFAEGIAAVKRSLLFVSLRVPSGMEGGELVSWVEETIGKATLGEVNLLVAEAAAAGEETVLGAMYILKDRGLVHRLGVAGEAEMLIGPVESGLFDAIVTPFNLLSGWRERNLVRIALERQIGVIAIDPDPAALAPMVAATKVLTKPGWFKKAAPLAGSGTYAFLTSTPGWTQEQICLAYALTEPAVATVQMSPTSHEHLASLAEIADRLLTSAVSAQIEMARFSIEKDAAPAARRSA